jgi:hypothetical protein
MAALLNHGDEVIIPDPCGSPVIHALTWSLYLEGFVPEIEGIAARNTSKRWRKENL